MSNHLNVPYCVVVFALLLSCRTAHFDHTTETAPYFPDGAEDIQEETAHNAVELRRYAVEEELKEVDIEQTVIYIDRPVYSPVEPEPPAPFRGNGR